MSGRKPENVYKEAFRKRLKRIFGMDVWIFPTQEVARRGIPDLIICLLGNFVAFEIKTDRDFYTLSDRDALQTRSVELINQSGGYACKMCPALEYEVIGKLKQLQPRLGQDLRCTLPVFRK